MQTNRNLILGIAGVIILLAIAYLVFQYQPQTAAMPGETATSTATSTAPDATNDAPVSTGTGAKPIASGGAAVITTPTGGAGDFGVVIDTSNAKVGGTIPSIKVNLPANSNGKVLEIALKPASVSAQPAPYVLLATTISTDEADASSYRVTGLKLATAVDGRTGQKWAVEPGEYQLETILWDKSPFIMNGTYGNFAGNNATAVLSGTFTISK